MTGGDELGGYATGEDIMAGMVEIGGEDGMPKGDRIVRDCTGDSVCN